MSDTDVDKLIQELIYEVRMLVGIVFLQLFLITAICGVVAGYFLLSSK